MTNNKPMTYRELIQAIQQLPDSRLDDIVWIKQVSKSGDLELDLYSGLESTTYLSGEFEEDLVEPGTLILTSDVAI
jgi:hypothetical protein